MQAFKFSLQAILALREKQEKEALQKYGEALQAQERAFSLRESTRHELEEAQTYFHARLTKDFNVAELTQLRNRCDEIEDRLQQCERKAITARNEAKRYFTKLLSARHATAVMVKLQATQLHHHRQEQHKMEQMPQHDLDGRSNSLSMLLQLTQRALWN
jgi:flagellar export protein FliJ